MPGDAYGYSAGSPKPQTVLNESWPPTDVAAVLKNVPEPIPVTVRLVFDTDGEQQLAGRAVRWWQRHVYVELDDHRIRSTGVWVDAGDVKRT